MQKDVYEVTARVYVNTSSQLRMLLEDQIVGSSVNNQVRYVREALLGRPQLEKLVRKTTIDAYAEGSEDLQRIIDGIARNMIIVSDTELLPRRSRPRGPTQDDTYSITYRHTDRGHAVNVVQTMLDIFVEDTLSLKKSSSVAAGEFISRQVQEYELRLVEAERSLANFKRKNIDRLPAMQGDYFDRLESATVELGTAQRELELRQSRLASIEQQIRGEAPHVTLGELDPNSLEARILENEARLDDLRLRFTDNHPDVVAARETSEILRARAATHYAELAASAGQISSSNNPVYQALLISKNELQAEIATHAADVSYRQTRVNEIRDLINETPEVEAEMARLSRDYNVVNAQYQTLVNSLEREKLSRQVGESDSVEFRVIDPPIASFDPVSPNRLMLLLVVLVGSLGLGTGVGYVMDRMNPVFLSRQDISEVIAYPVIGEVSILEGSS